MKKKLLCHKIRIEERNEAVQKWVYKYLTMKENNIISINLGLSIGIKEILYPKERGSGTS